MLVFNDFLIKAGLEPKAVAIMLHTPRTAKLKRLLPWIVRTRPELFEAYQSSHAKPATATLRKRAYVAAFVGLGDGTLVLAGIYRNHGESMRPMTAIKADPVVAELMADFAVSWLVDGVAPESWPWFDLRRTEDLAGYVGRLRIAPNLTQTYVRLAETFPGEVISVERESLLDAPPPDWRDMMIEAADLKAKRLPDSWLKLLQGWRGVYLIVDQSDGARYVGAAYGEDNFLGRWRAHVAREVGATVGTAERATANFRFCILERVSPDMVAEEVIRLEHTWIARLDTKNRGLNT